MEKGCDGVGMAGRVGVCCTDTGPCFLFLPIHPFILLLIHQPTHPIYSSTQISTQKSHNHSIHPQRICLREGDLEQRVILTENMDQIESLCYDWTSKQLYWLDVAHKRIECVKLDGEDRKKNVTKGWIKEKDEIGGSGERVGRGGKRVVVLDELINPRSLAIMPTKG